MPLYSARPIHEEIVTKVFEKCYEYISISFSEGIINETTKNALLSVGLILLGSNEVLRERATVLPQQLISILPEYESLTNYENVFLCLGDIFRSFPGIIEDTNDLIEVCVRTATDFINLQNESPLTSVFYALTYIILSNPEIGKAHIDQIFQFSQHISEIEFGDDKSSIFNQREIYTAVLPLNGAIIQTQKYEPAWINANKKILFHPALTIPINYSNFLFEKSLFQFLKLSMENIPKEIITKYNTLLNNKNIKHLLLHVSKKSTDRYTHAKEARELYAMINKQ